MTHSELLEAVSRKLLFEDLWDNQNHINITVVLFIAIEAIQTMYITLLVNENKKKHHENLITTDLAPKSPKITSKCLDKVKKFNSYDDRKVDWGNKEKTSSSWHSRALSLATKLWELTGQHPQKPSQMAVKTMYKQKWYSLICNDVMHF